MATPITQLEEESKIDFQHEERIEQHYVDTDIDSHHQVEVAAEILRQAGNIEYTEAEDKAVLRKIDIWIVSECGVGHPPRWCPMLTRRSSSPHGHHLHPATDGEYRVVATRWRKPC
jgi:hypothetical protein